MLVKDFQKKFNKWFILFFVGLMVLVFIFVGVFPAASNAITGGSSVASVGGEAILFSEFQRVLSREMQAYKAFGDQLPPFFLQQIQERALQGLIQQKLLSLEAKQLGIYVSNKEVMYEIERQPFFQNEETKKFDVNRYKEVLQANNLNPGAYENMIQEELMRGKLVQFFQSRIRITDAELMREYELAGSKRNLEYARIHTEDAYPQMTVDAALVKQFLTDKDKKNLIESHYNSNIRKYKKDDEICARHILKRDPNAAANAAAKGKDAKPDAEEKTPKEFANLQPTKANFESLAKKFSEDPTTKVKGGDLGCFSKGMMDENFEKVAFSTPVGKISKIVKSAFGWHYIYVYDKKPGFEKKLPEVERGIAEELIKKDRFSEVQKINRKRAEEIAKRWAAGDKKGLTIQETGQFPRVQTTIPTIGKSSEIQNAAFNPTAKIQKEPQIFEAAGGIIIAKVKEKVEPDLAKFASEKDKQLKTLQTRKLEAFFPAWMEYVQTQFPVKRNTSMLEKLTKAQLQ